MDFRSSQNAKAAINAARKQSAILLLDFFPDEGVWEHYPDNGEHFTYRGHYHKYRVTAWENESWDIEIVHAG